MILPKQRAEVGLELIENAILDFIRPFEQGVSNAQIAEELGLHSDIDGEHRNYLTWSILGNLVKKKQVIKVGERHSARYIARS
ncbi:hypothetical protein [Shewanella xiamenensis]|uniref:hypothetical protein n=1 Tax=Shewanella xiamenensis TaxID=332186 RepID=UPI0024A640C2|nr:hypothetical protein [Shewanella xiamenensis]MDI5876537.1 hypothetical protein [Shewanella xiamenensis]